MPAALAPRNDLSAPSVIEPVPEKPEAPDRPPEPVTSPALRTARWVTAAAAVVFVAGGAAGFVIRERNVRNFNDDKCSLDRGTVKGLPGQGSACQALAQNASTAKVVGIVGMAGAGLLAVSSAVLFIAF